LKNYGIGIQIEAFNDYDAMGIKGLHKALSFCTVKDNLRNYRNTVVAVDASSWMHKSVYSISEKYVEATDRGHWDQGCVRVSARYIVARCNELITQFGIKAVFLVMDGKRIPLKADETHDRDQKRQQNLREARKLKKSGQKWKAEDKYKSCIRIKDEFTKAVMAEVRTAFHGSSPVYFVNSPYEADSQLAKIVLDGVADAVITEDSDVLLYSAAANVAFPVLFKLDRKTGNCDRIKMDWLLSLSPEEARKPVTSNNTLEIILRRLAVKETYNKGSGARLFVQGCIMAGCDYRKNIEGIGTTNAFKLVRENAHRKHSERFLGILKSLPKKLKQNMDITEYEEILAKSEAIFYYHPVLHDGTNIKPILNPRLTPDESECKQSNTGFKECETGGTKHFTDHFPSMHRFQGDWSFLGTIDSETNSSVAQNGKENIESKRCEKAGSIEMHKGSLAPTRKRGSSEIPLPSKSKITHNPYKKNKHADTKGIAPFMKRNANFYAGPEKKNTQSKKAGGITQYLEKPDPRMPRRSFALTSRASSSFRIPSSSNISKKSSIRSFFSPRSRKEQDTTLSAQRSRAESNNNVNPSATVGEATSTYPISKRVDSVDNDLKSKLYDPLGDSVKNSNQHDFYDLTSLNSCDSDDLSDGAAVNDPNDIIEKDHPISINPPKNAEIVCEEDKEVHRAKEQGTTASKYFMSRNSRRVTLDPISPKMRNDSSVGTSSRSTNSSLTSFFSPRKPKRVRHRPQCR